MTARGRRRRRRAVTGSGSAPAASSSSRTGTWRGATGSSPATGAAGRARSTWSCGRGAGELVFCEVKTRSSDRFGVAGRGRHPGQAAAACACWPPASSPTTPTPVAGRRGLRFDVASVIAGRVEVIEARVLTSSGPVGERLSVQRPGHERHTTSSAPATIRMSAGGAAVLAERVEAHGRSVSCAGWAHVQVERADGIVTVTLVQPRPEERHPADGVAEVEAAFREIGAPAPATAASS